MPADIDQSLLSLTGTSAQTSTFPFGVQNEFSHLFVSICVEVIGLPVVYACMFVSSVVAGGGILASSSVGGL